jgi:hypothetical protein
MKKHICKYIKISNFGVRDPTVWLHGAILPQKYIWKDKKLTKKFQIVLSGKRKMYLGKSLMVKSPTNSSQCENRHLQVYKNLQNWS